ncbi:hemerythrin domain-containing protein [Streptomyces sp. NRRL F-4489]|uniref:hemerythrin domain-containing protein n=1 Tax=Streptomyces sp. NRRL F-4489 TaxID=1609095 RepID=UPI0018FE6621|nr:hemerythrin domain-containing protein [Streptomyces sp. NRRL F-4489]
MTSHERLAAFGNQLIQVHLWLREELATLREGIDAYLTGGARLRELRTHCLTFCSALNRHHSGEDNAAFPAVAEQFPELRPVLVELRRDHELVEESLQRLNALIRELDRESDPTAVRREVDSLTALMETHFLYEEKRIVAALNALNVPEWKQAPPAFLLTDDTEI